MSHLRGKTENDVSQSQSITPSPRPAFAASPPPLFNDKKIGLQRWVSTVFIAAAISYASEAIAEPKPWGVQLFAGAAKRNINRFGLGISWDPNWSWGDTSAWHFSLIGEGQLAFWHIGTHERLHAHIIEAGITPIFRFEKNGGRIRPYLEAGIGVRLISHPRISADYTLSSAFQFADMVGIGAKLGDHQQYQAGLRFQHLSNAGLKRPNPGINFYQVYVQHNF